MLFEFNIPQWAYVESQTKYKYSGTKIWKRNNY